VLRIDDGVWILCLYGFWIDNGFQMAFFWAAVEAAAGYIWM
jgi:hypothetical protein